MKKTLRKSLSLVLAVVMLISCMVFSLPGANAASFPQTLYNGETAVTYTANHALQGNYLVEVDVIKFSPNYMLAPAAIKSEAGDIIITYSPGNGLEAEKTLTLDDIIPANTFNFEGEAQRTYYAVVEGFPTKATVSMKKTNIDANDSGIYAGIKIWDCTIGTFNVIYDPIKVQRENGAETASLMFSNIEVLNQYYPYAKNGSASGGNLTLPANITNPTTSSVNFAVTDQWGVTMVAPKITAPSIAGLTFSQDKNVVTLKGTGDANYYSSSNNYRDVTVKATYSTANENASGLGSVSQTCRITNSSTKTYAPTYDNRTKAGLSLWFTAGSTDNPDKFNLDSSHKMTTKNYLKIKNNSTRTATIKRIESTTANSSYYDFVFDNDTTLAAGATLSVEIQDMQSASSNYAVDADITYTLAGLYSATSSSTPLILTCGTTIPCVYKYQGVNTNTTVQPKQTGGITSNVVVDVSLNGGSNVIYNQKSFGLKSGASDEYEWTADCYINRDSFPTYQSAGMGFHFVNAYGDRDNQYYFQKEDSYSGTHKQGGTYDSIGSFGFTTSATAHTDGKKEVTAVDIGKGKGKSNDQPFYGTLFGGSTSSTAPAKLIFEKLQLHCTTGWANSTYFSLTLDVYSYSKADLRSSVTTARNTAPLSCYYTTSAYNNYNKMSSSSKLKAALLQLGYDKTTQYDISQAKANLDEAYSALINGGVKGGTYCVVHQKHSGDINTPITATSVDYLVFEVGSTNTLKLNSDFESACDKHSPSFVETPSTHVTNTHIYDYWNLNFTNLEQILDDYNDVAVPDPTHPEDVMFSNIEDAKSQLETAEAIYNSSSDSYPENQNDIEVAAAELKAALRNLVYISYDMTITHRIQGPNGIIYAEGYEPYTEVVNETATYGEVLDGTKDIDDSTFTIKDHHYYPVKSEKFMERSTRCSTTGISTTYKVKESKTITMTYTAKVIEDTQLKDAVDEIRNHAAEMRAKYTKSTFDEFYDWYQEHKNYLRPEAYSVFDEEAYYEALATYKAEEAKLDELMTQEQAEALENFMFNYEVVQNMPSAYCGGANLLTAYSGTYRSCQNLLAAMENSDAGKNAAQAVIETSEGFTPRTHIAGEKSLSGPPQDGIAGTYVVLCANQSCNAQISSKTLPNPNFNTAVRSYYNYSNRGAALCYSEDEASLPDTQHVRFPASCVVPKNAVVEDFGFVFIPTIFLNGGTEPEDNIPVNVNSLIIGGVKVTQRSVYNDENPHYTLHPQADGSNVYTFNLKLGLNREQWDMHYAVRSYVKYSYDGISVTVYDKTYSSRSASYIAKCVIENPNELETAKEVIGAKFGLK